MKTECTGEVAPAKRAARKRLDLPNRAFRTGVGNGSALLHGVDERSLTARRYREVSAAITSDLGGETHLSEAQDQIVRSAAGLVVMREALDARVVNGEQVDVAEYCRISNSLRRLLATIGLERRAHDVTPTIDEIARERPQ